jgi:hypothetical protein
MKKNTKKLRLHRETLSLLDSQIFFVRGAAEAAFVTSCTYPCGCPTGCSDEQACIETARA